MASCVKIVKDTKFQINAIKRMPDSSKTQHYFVMEFGYHFSMLSIRHARRCYIQLKPCVRQFKYV